MVSTAAHRGAPRPVTHDATDWARVVVATVARAGIAVVLGLAFWAAVPAAVGWEPTTVVTGSMAPRLLPSDVVVSRPVDHTAVEVGRVLLADDPDQAGHLRLHRYVEPGDRGTLVTKGDANPRVDSTPVQPDAVRGVAVLRVPFVGLPVTWARDGDWARLALLALAVAAALALCSADRSLRRAGLDHADDHDGPDPGRDGREARGGPAPSLPSGGPTVGTRRSAHRAGSAAAVALLVVGAGVLPSPSAIAVPFSRATASTASFGAGTPRVVTGLTCAAASATSVRISWSYPGSTADGVPIAFELLSGSTVVASAPGTATSLPYGGSGLLSLGTFDLQLRTNLGGTWTAETTQPVRVTLVSVVGLGVVAQCG
ncbi:hypothetical protein Csp2054_01865 [Curtobacterium sp. 'Ferrero']|uniref:hypothetical protein n=1 Tax=Curtobacterium sp. 'Ferrero' TaxID=2033654 RepID=UPI000BC9A978|nr:hypothetical protein [Curtobacterium sp. 'Ferrero']PCN49706.1 hypothetical protein Csp2054_01865 [Curtobacterium sp. 'Ferrero']